MGASREGRQGGERSPFWRDELRTAGCPAAGGAAAAPPRAGSVVMAAAGRKWEGFVVPPVGEGCEPPSRVIRGSGC